MNEWSSKTSNPRALIGKLTRFDKGIRSLFEQAIFPKDGSPRIFSNFNGSPIDRREIQTYPEWKVQMCFRNLSRHHRKRSSRKIIYILPIGPFTEAVWKPIEGLQISVFELLANFLRTFFQGMDLKIMDEILVSEVNCTRRIHTVTGKLQLLASDMLRHLKSSLPPDGYCIIGICWVDLYPDAQWNFVLGESSCTDGCAVMSFGHFEPQSFIKKQQNQIQVNINADHKLQKNFSLLYNRNCISQKLFVEEFTDAFEINKELIWRLFRVSSHELCHVFGFSHCAYFACAMNESKSISEAENQPLFLCPVCLRKLEKVLCFDTVERYKALDQFFDWLIIIIEGRDSDRDQSDCKLKSAIHWLKTVIRFIESASKPNFTAL